MVGIARKSKACLTCRRRRKKCDLQQPFCQKCLDGGRVCEGYARYPVFINRTKEGIVKRKPFEEAKPSQDDLSSSAPLMPSFAALKVVQQSSYPCIQKPVPDSVPLQPKHAAAYEAQLIATFWEHWSPKHSAQSGCQVPWLQQTLSLSDPSPALRLSLKALAMSRLGWIHRDGALTLSGRTLYGQALQVIQKALYDETTMWQDETLASGNILSVYEFCEPTNDSIAGWNDHTNGVTRLMLLRGPDRHRSAFGYALLESVRLSAMVQAVQNRKASPLGHPEWGMRPLDEKQKEPRLKKDFSQRLYDHGFALAALFEDIDKANLLRPDTPSSLLAKYLRRCSALDATFNLWHQDFARHSPTPLHWLTPPNDGLHHTTIPPLTNRTPFSFPDLRTAHLTTTFWGCKLALSNTIALICSSILSSPTPIQPNQEIPSTPPNIASLARTAHQLLHQHGDDGRLENATNIIRSMPYCLHDSMGALGPQKSLFALRAALLSLRRRPGEELEWCLGTYQQLVEGKGLGYAREVGKMNGRDRVGGGEAVDAVGLALGHGE